MRWERCPGPAWEKQGVHNSYLRAMTDVQMLSDLATSLAAASLDVTVLCSQSRYDDPTARLPAFEIVNNYSNQFYQSNPIVVQANKRDRIRYH